MPLKTRGHKLPSWPSRIATSAKALLSLALPLSLIVTFTLGCTEGVPTFEDLGKSLNPPQISKGDSAFIISSLSQTLTIEGSCDRRGQFIHLRQPGSEWLEASTIAGAGYSLSCKNQSFKLPIENLGTWMGFSGVNGEEKLLNLRFSGPLFVPVETQIRIRFWDSEQRPLAQGRFQGFISLGEPNSANAANSFFGEYSIGDNIQGIQVQSQGVTPPYQGVLSVQGLITDL